ncbi:signal transduction histidine kinase [Dokdonella fugitiva]|uniref:histidine kinase n=1 Tax=Dokdonella fugitiva TaxID=328517 RepID=A0A839F4B5_9GAMM|nr:HAMP domain-containing sensor histidine kinase [Dokdonella fugitiva]MBA8889903.1 signal transduction histidine kinase [Dokdonella fugitiva]
MSAGEAAARQDGLSGRWRSSTKRLILVYGAFFVAWTVVLIGAIRWQTANYLDGIVDSILEQRLRYLSSVERAHLPALLAATTQLDLRGLMASGLFDAQGHYIAGDVDHLPDGLAIDGVVHPLPEGVQRISGERAGRMHAVALRLGDGSVMLLARDYRVVDQVGAIIRSGLLWALSLTLVPGLLGGYLLSRGPLRRVRDIETAIQPVMRGDLGARLPVSERRDELDMLAAIVNRMLEQIERLLGEVKGVSDSIAHDLRTPLTRLRTQLHRVQQLGGDGDPRNQLVERCIVEADALLDRFRALLRISELEDIGRRAGFGTVDVGETLRRVHELYAPLAEEKEIAFALEADAVPALRADGHLLFEAIGNLVDNAIKFAPRSGHVVLRAASEGGRVVIDVVDDGRGIPVDERDAVLHRFYRSAASGAGDAVGHGLGLPLVAAIARLHGYEFSIGDNPPRGTRMRLWC